jgi:mRNA-degrading endonuclease RelE of RelBE toxin-antitoxin system
MPNEPSPIEIDLSPRFTRDLRDLAKHYRKIRSDLQALIDQLLQGETPGDRIQGVKSVVFKVRLRNSDIQKGKSGGYRVIYYLKSLDRILLITIYAKSDREDIDLETLITIITEYEKRFLPDERQ